MYSEVVRNVVVRKATVTSKRQGELGFGTERFCSIRVHELERASRRDDVESVIYCVLFPFELDRGHAIGRRGGRGGKKKKTQQTVPAPQNFVRHGEAGVY